MAHFIQVGNAFINLDQVTVLDLDRPQGRSVLRVYGQAPGVVWETEIALDAETHLKTATGAAIRISARDAEGGPVG